MNASVADRRIRSLRPPKPRVDPQVAQGWLVEEERRPAGGAERALTVFLSGAECPFTCSFCDLWRHTIDGPTSRGALPGQLARVLEQLELPLPDRIKLYNASNFFDARAVPVEDVPELARLAGAFSGVTVESHASTVGERALELSRLIPGRLEVAMGLETIHPVAAAHLNKRLDVARFDRAAAFLGDHDIDLRVFVLLGVPQVASEESVEWTVRTAGHAARRGARTIAIIPVRGGNGELERLAAEGQFVPPTLSQLEDALDQAIACVPSVVTADLWDIERLASCAGCGPARVERLRRMNRTGRSEIRVTCARCGGAGG